ncbi:TonB-dependent hemoglobin/transferrin/lactoferrin family receptor [Corticibacterium sp. UT-5YL-CI-8]|nr:TonB-dependent hemoglobin/transferrin/lactoferrin family receptor [Tianweitania sp. UT-5YL-CI-8]
MGPVARFEQNSRAGWGETAAFKRRTVALLTGVAAFTLGVTAASAQQAPNTTLTTEPTVVTTGENDGSVIILDQITIVSRTGESAIDSLASVSQVSGEELERRMANGAAGVLFGVPGVAVQSDAKRAISSINIRGLQDFGRVAVIVDGSRQNFQRSGHGTQTVFALDPELIKQVDVIRGPVANTYGSGAIGGVVAFETKTAQDFLKDGETWAGSVTGRYETNGKGFTTSATGAYKFSDAADILGNIVYRNFDDYKDGGGDTVANSGFDVLSGIINGTVRPTENSELKLGWIGANDSWTESSGSYDAELKQNTFTARYNITDDEKKWLDLHINASVNSAALTQTYLKDTVQFNSETGRRVIIPAGAAATYDLDTYGLDIWNTSRFETGALGHELTYGGDVVSDDVVTTSADGGANVYTPSGKRTVWGLHVQDKIEYDEWLEIIGGLRYDSYKLDSDKAEASGDRVSPRITVGVSPFSNEALKGLQFYGTYAEGYRSPSTSETLISGLHPNGVAFPFLPNPDLKPETGKTWEFGLNYKRDGLVYSDDSLRLKAAYFNNDVDDYIGSATLSAFPVNDVCPVRWDLLMTPGSGYIPICFQYQNFATAKISGFEMEAVYDAGHVFAGLSASIIDGYTVSYEGIREDLTTTPSSQVTASLGFRLLEDKSLTVGGEVQYNSKPDGAAAIVDDYTLVNLFANYQVNENFRLDFRADNVFDVKYTNPLNASTTTAIYEPGVTLKFGATMRFGG